jgi:hypothetical protein
VEDPRGGAQGDRRLAGGDHAGHARKASDVLEPATVVCSRVRELHEPFPLPPSRSKSGSRNARVAALQERWDRLRAGLELILDQRGADMADVPGGTSGMLMRHYKGKKTRTGW